MLGNFIVETVNNPGVATLNLLGAATGRVTFSSIFSSGSQCYYYISDGTSFEYGIGTSTTGAPNTLSRDTVFGNSSGTTSKINFSGLCTVWNDLPAQARIGYSTRSRIDPTSGYLGLGLTAPSSRLHVSGDASTGVDNVCLRLTDTGASGRSVAWGTSAGVTALRDITGSIDYISISAAGNMSVSGTLSAPNMSVSGTLSAPNVTVSGTLSAPNVTASSAVTIGSGGLIYDTGGNSMSVRAGYGGGYAYYRFEGSVSGNAYALNGSWINSSDVSLKTDVVTIPDALDLVLRMRGVYYTKISNGSRLVGVIGNEMEIVCPEATSRFEDHEGRELVGVNYGSLVAPLIEAIRVLNQKISAMELRLAVAAL